jgi:hypothetical protein
MQSNALSQSGSLVTSHQGSRDCTTLVNYNETRNKTFENYHFSPPSAVTRIRNIFAMTSRNVLSHHLHFLVTYRLRTSASFKFGFKVGSLNISARLPAEPQKAWHENPTAEVVRFSFSIKCLDNTFLVLENLRGASETWKCFM